MTAGGTGIPGGPGASAPGGPPGPYGPYGPHGGPFGPYGPPPQAPEPGVIPLRPLNVGDIVGAVFGTVGRHWRQLYGITLAVIASATLAAAAVVAVAAALTWGSVDRIVTALDRSEDFPDLTGGQIAGLAVTWSLAAIVLAAVGLYAFSALTAVHATATSRAVLGQSFGAGELWRAARPRVPSVLGTQLIAGLATGGIILIIYAVVALVVVSLAASAGTAAPALTVLAVLALIVVVLGGIVAAFFLSMRWLLAPTAATLEGGTYRQALGRSWRLVRGSWWRVLGITMLVSLIASMIQQIIQYAVFFVVGIGASTTLAGGGEPSPAALLGLGALVGCVLALGSVVTVPFTYLTSSLIYVDLRIRRESLDLELARAAGLPPHR